MQIHELKITKKKCRKRVARGGKRGTYSGRGMKGQKSRSGARINPLFEGGRTSLIMRLKKMKGFKSKRPRKININLDYLNKHFENNQTVDLASFHKIGLVAKIKKAKKHGVKVLGTGKLTKKLVISKEILLTKSAKEAVEKVGGKVEEVKGLPEISPKREAGVKNVKKDNKKSDKKEKVEKKKK